MPVVFGKYYGSDLTAQWPSQHPAQPVVPISRIRTVVVPLDGSHMAERALPHAVAIARRAQATIRLVHVHSLLDSIALLNQSCNGTLGQRLNKQAYLASIVRQIKQLADVQITAVVVECDDIASALCKAVAGASLVVMAGQPRGLLGRIVYGSVTETLMRTLPCPIFRVSVAGPVLDLTDDPMPRHVLIPLDGTEFAEGIVDTAAAIGSLSDARFTLAHFQHVREAQMWPDRFSACGDLHEVIWRIKQRMPYANMEFVVSNRGTAGAILSFIEEEGIDMVALTTRGRHGLARLIKGSVAASVARGAKKPVLVVCPSCQKAEGGQSHLERSFWSWI